MLPRVSWENPILIGWKPWLVTSITNLRVPDIFRPSWWYGEFYRMRKTPSEHSAEHVLRKWWHEVFKQSVLVAFEVRFRAD